MSKVTWVIHQLDRNASDESVINAHWRAFVELDGFYSTVYGSKGFKPNTNDPNFIPFSELTEEKVLEWIWRTVNKEEIETSLLLDIELKKNPNKLTGLPW